MAVRNRLAAIFDLSDTTMSPREEFSRQTQDALAKRVSFRCAICRCATSGPHEDPTKTVNVGVAAHISAASPGGPRYDPRITSVERTGIRNGIWLCQKHAKLVDSDPIRFTVEWLQQLKARAEQATRLELEGRLPIQHDSFHSLEVSIAHLPTTGNLLVERDKEVELLDRTWTECSVNVITLVAWGGVGKSCLVNRWLREMAKKNYEGAERVFGWSFYRQGSDGGAVSGDLFVSSALRWFGDTDPVDGGPWDRGVRLAKVVRARRTLLLLDGLELLQHPPGPQEGQRLPL